MKKFFMMATLLLSVGQAVYSMEIEDSLIQTDPRTYLRYLENGPLKEACQSRFSWCCLFCCPGADSEAREQIFSALIYCTERSRLSAPTAADLNRAIMVLLPNATRPERMVEMGKLLSAIERLKEIEDAREAGAARVKQEYDPQELGQPYEDDYNRRLQQARGHLDKYKAIAAKFETPGSKKTAAKKDDRGKF